MEWTLKWVLTNFYCSFLCFNNFLDVFDNGDHYIHKTRPFAKSVRQVSLYSFYRRGNCNTEHLMTFPSHVLIGKISYLTDIY